MKRRKYRGIALIVLMAMGIVVYLEACKKEYVTPINNSESNTIVGKINKFKKQLVEKENVMRSGLYMPIDSVIWNVEALFNAEFAFPERKYLETVKQELEFFVDVNENDEAPFGAVADLYDEITNSVRTAYSCDGISSDKSLMAVVVDKGEKTGDKVKLNVFVISGKIDSGNFVNEPVQLPFKKGDCWYYGEYGGTCDDPSVFGDAAEIIEDTINYYYGGKTVPQAGFRSINFSMFRVVLDGNEYFDENGEPYLYFYSVNGNPPLYLNYDLLNYYYTRELEVLLHAVPSDPRYQSYLPATPAFIEVDIIGMLDYVGNGSCYHHKNYVVYGSKMSVPEQELPPLRDLLN